MVVVIGFVSEHDSIQVREVPIEVNSVRIGSAQEIVRSALKHAKIRFCSPSGVTQTESYEKHMYIEWSLIALTCSVESSHPSGFMEGMI
jgi:hypothetical protein